ncbi:hypothetical protein ACHAWU_008813 [Discostella pseudostelligera]|uniref:Fatty acid hydroxylase domain-containing protein n=1 Tax=Discostella pseudostelligera TaxID=259834 RepID=A0ABD3MZV6_9STRA
MSPKNSCLSAIAAALLCSTSCQCQYGFIGTVNVFTRSSLPHHNNSLRNDLSRCRRDNTILFQGQSNIITPRPILEAKTENNYIVASEPIIVDMQNRGESSTCTTEVEVAAIQRAKEETVPSTWSHALQRFFIREPGPSLVLLSISGFIYTRIQSSMPFSIAELSILASSIIVWWIQEYFFHRILLHSSFQWIGKSIHRTHHEKTYFHISIDPPELLLGWLFAAHFILKSVLPLHYCLSATIGYALAGLVYEWSHYIVHTKVRPPSSSFFLSETLSRLFSQMRDNHMRHHLVDDRYWYAFSVPAMDDLFETNPDVKEVRKSNGTVKLRKLI